jgi:hypothetical protein
MIIVTFRRKLCGARGLEGFFKICLKTFAFTRNGDILRGLINSIKKRMRLSPAGLSCRVKAEKIFEGGARRVFRPFL